MTPTELRKELRRRRKALRRSAVLSRRAARERMELVPAVRRERTRRRIRRLVGLAALLLLAMLMRCECDTPPPPPPPEPEVKVTPEVKPKPPAPPSRAKPKPLRDWIARKPRGKYQNAPQTSPSWLDDFRLQVAARSPRLAQCFSGSDRPGALRWTTAVNSDSGAVSDHALELVGTGADLSGKQRECVLGALSSPGYRLKPEHKQALPNRVSIVIEF
jgi:hypothetical protein